MGLEGMPGKVCRTDHPSRKRTMIENNPNTANAPTILGEVSPQELQRLSGLKQQADQVVHRIGVHRVQEYQLIEQLRSLENATNAIVREAGKRLGIADGTAWSVTSDGKAVMVGAPPVAMTPQDPTTGSVEKVAPSLVPDPAAEITNNSEG